MSRPRRLLVAVLAVSLLAGPVVAHVPAFTAENTTPATAHEIDPPTKSWAIYDDLAADQVRYYALDLAAGDRLELGLFTPSGGPFEPSMAVMSPRIDARDEVPARVTVPEGYGTVVVDGETAAHPSFEPNTPAAIYGVADYGREVDAGGRYLVAVYEPDGRAGAVGVVAGGRESFTLEQYVTVAWALPRIYLWEGDHPLVVFGPALLVVAGGLAWVRRRLGSREDAVDTDGNASGGRPGPPAGPRYALAAAGLLCVGSAASVLVQTVQATLAAGPTAAVAVPVVFVALPATLGAAVTVRAADPSFALGRRDRAFLSVAGLVALGTWAGYVVAPLALLAGAAAPQELFDRGSA